jgi:hypothetical protein
MEDTYDEFKRDPQRFKTLFNRRLSATEEKVRQYRLKDRIKEVRKELRMRYADGLQPNNKVEELKRECSICLEGKADAVIMNCGHGGLCFDCGTRLSANKAD